MAKPQEFFSILEDMNQGRTLTKLETKLAELLDSVADTEQAGELIVKLKIAPKKKNLHQVTCTITTKLPQEAPEAAVFFMNSGNKLQRDDPRQTEMFPKGKVVAGPGAEAQAS